MDNLLIIGGTIDPRTQIAAAEDRMFQDFIKGYETSEGRNPEGNDNPHFWFDRSGKAYHPFKTMPVLQHRFSHSTVIGLAELILEQEAASLGIASHIMPIEALIDSRWRLRDPDIFDRFTMLALSTTYIPTPLLFFLLRYIPIPSDIKIFLGGPGAYKLREKELQGLRFSYLLRSEAEGRFRKLLLHAKGEDIDLSKIPGLTWREGNQLYHSPEPYTYIDLNAALLPDTGKIARSQNGWVLYESARGCPFRCEFCDYPFLMGNQKFRYKTANRIHEDWWVMHEKMGARDILCLDSLFTYPPERLRQLCNLISNSGLNKKVRWGCYARSDDLTCLEATEMMREAGCEYVYIGFESGSQKVLESMNKNCKVEDNRKAIINCDKSGIVTFGLFIVGFPGETPELFQETREFLTDTPPFLLSIVPWMPDFAEDSKVPVMRPERMKEFGIQLENPSSKQITLWKNCSFRRPSSMPWGSYWTHRGMDLQTAWDCIGEVVKDIYEQRIRAMSEELFLPRLLDDPLNLYCQLGQQKAVDFYLGLSRMVLDNNREGFADWCKRVELKI